ncbi:MAG: ABC transporter substrate-binding protein [Candidatus Dormibacteraeota bacterium]|nr:ABC transporter substrate-binding protein [Candidatus Dormibacteraeota bacterium]
MRKWTLVLAASLVILLAGCASGGATSKSSSGGATVTFALPAGVTPTYISPFVSGPVSNNIDLFQFTPFMWRPLYWFGSNGTPSINYQQSMAGPPAYSNGGKTVTVTLNHKFTWSNGKPVTNRDVELWLNILMVEKGNYLGYSPGSIPDDLASMSFPQSTPYQFSLTFNKAYSPLWILYDELSEIVPIPQQAWDRTSSTTPVGNYDLTAAGATAVYKYLNGQATTESTYTTNPLWKVVDGPWTLNQFSTVTGASTFVPNRAYTGPGKPHIARFEELPFTSTSAEFDALRSGQLDYGYLPPEDATQAAYFRSKGYTVANWTDFGFNNFFLNYTSPNLGPVFKQLYVRQALQTLINQPQISQDIWHGYAFPTYGPIPQVPSSNYLSATLKKNPYPYSVAHAESLLRAHGWTVVANGTDTCVHPGTGADQCGANIPAGTKLAFTEEVATGSAPFLAEAEDMVSSWASAGISVTIQQKSESAIFATLEPCSSGDAGCNWQMANFGEPGSTPTYSPQYLPAPGPWFGTDASNNVMGYSNARMDQLIAATYVNGSIAAVQNLAEYAAEQLPGLWEPNYAYQISVISPKLRGAVPQDPNLNLYPQNWSVS